jgi:hypothetical protein
MTCQGRLISRVSCALGVVFFLTCGCSPKITETQLPAVEQQLQYIGMAYQQASTELGRGPTSLAEFKGYLGSYGDPESLLLTPGGQPIQVVWNIKTSEMRRGAMPIIAFATDGEGGYTGIDFQLSMRRLEKEEIALLKPSGS